MDTRFQDYLKKIIKTVFFLNQALYQSDEEKINSEVNPESNLFET
jgi:hypothetical protein